MISSEKAALTLCYLSQLNWWLKFVRSELMCVFFCQTWASIWLEGCLRVQSHCWKTQLHRNKANFVVYLMHVWMQPRSGPFIGMDHNAFASTNSHNNQPHTPSRPTNRIPNREMPSRRTAKGFYLWVQIAARNPLRIKMHSAPGQLVFSLGWK